MRAYLKLKLVSKRTQCLLEWQSEDSSVATLYYKKKSFNTNNLFKFRITLWNISTAFNTRAVFHPANCIVSDSDHLKQELSRRFNCPATLRISTLVYCNCHYPHLLLQEQTRSQTQVYLLQKVIYCARASRTKMASPRFFKESLRSVEFTFSLNPSHQLCQRLVRPKDEIVAEEKFGVIVMQSTTVKQQGHWAQGLNDLNEHRKSVHACGLKSAVSEHAKDAGHSIDEISVKIIGQENHLLPLRKIREAIDIHNLQLEMNCDQGYNLSPIYGTILQPHQNEAANNSKRHH